MNNIKDMHYDYKQKLNVVDSQKYRGLKVPEIDWKLNEAHELFVKMIAEPRVQEAVGFELNQRTIDDIKTVVINQTPATGLVPLLFEAKSYLVTLPSEYMFYIGSTCFADKGECLGKQLKVTPVQHDDEAEMSPFDRSNFEWRHINIRFIKEGIRMFTDTTFVPKKLCLNYIKKLKYIHNAEDFEGSTYTLLDGTVLTGVVNSELPSHVLSEIVDLAVFITAGDLNLSSYGIKANKLKLNRL